MIGTILIAVIVLMVVVIVAYPFFRPVHTTPPRSEPVLEELLSQRDAVYTAIKDLENEHATGKLSDADYRSLRVKYEARAVALLQELDRVVMTLPRADTEDAIEREIARWRRASASEGALQCPQCGATHTAADAFCARCGSALRSVRCPACGKTAAAQDRFCSRCGKELRGA